MVKEISAGGIVYKKTITGTFVAMVVDSFGKWTFPKGRQEKGESYEETVVREMNEELGIEKVNVKNKVGSIEIIFNDRFEHKGQKVHKTIHYYLAEAKPDDVIKIPSVFGPGEKIRGAAWVEISEVLQKSDYVDLEPIIKKAVKKLK